MSAPVDVLAVMDRALSACEAHTARTVYVGGDECFKRVSDNYGLPEARAAVAELIEATRELSADLEHAIGLANFGASGTVRDDHPIRVALNRVDAALARVGGGA